MNEIQRMNELKSHCTEQQKKEIDKCLDIISVTFRQMIGATSSYIIDGEKKAVSINEGFNALKAIGEIAKKVGFEFPEVKDDREARLYILVYGKDVIYS